MPVAIVSVGKLKEPYQRDGCAEFIKRMQRFGGIEIIELPDSPEPSKPSDALEQKLIEGEGQLILKRLKPDDFVVALCIEGKGLSSTDLADHIALWQQMGRRIVFVIGGSLGLSKAVTARADFKLSFSKMTFPHGLMRVILLEQVYRAMKIIAGEKYHK